MSRLNEIQEQYQCYVAAREAVAKTDPGKVEVVYKEGEKGEGIFQYNPTENTIRIHPNRHTSYCSVFIDADDVPALIKALREFFE